MQVRVFTKEVKFLGHILSQDGVRSDPDKVAAVVNMEEPMSVKELRCFLGMVNQLSKFMPHLAEMTKLLRDLSNKNQLMWGQAQKLAFSSIKDALTKSPALVLYDPNLETTISSADALSYSLGIDLLQTQTNGERRPVAYVSILMTPTES